MDQGLKIEAFFVVEIAETKVRTLHAVTFDGQRRQVGFCLSGGVEQLRVSLQVRKGGQLR